MSPLLELQNTLICRGEFRLQIDQLRLETGTIYTLYGDNGAGKSSLLQLLALLLPAESGEFRLAQQTVRWRGPSMSILRQQVTLVEQSPLLFSGTVEQNLAFGLKLRGIRGAKTQQRIDQALEATGLRGFNQRNARELSGGESRRVALARALALRPKLLLLDEPTANLDAWQVAALERSLIDLPDEGMCMVIATHDAEQSQRLGGRNIHLRNGRLYQLETQPPVQDFIPLLQQINGRLTG